MRDQLYMKIGSAEQKVNSLDQPSFKCIEIVDRIESLAEHINIKRTDKDRQRANFVKLKSTNFEEIAIKPYVNLYLFI